MIVIGGTELRVVANCSSYSIGRTVMDAVATPHCLGINGGSMTQRRPDTNELSGIVGKAIDILEELGYLRRPSKTRKRRLTDEIVFRIDTSLSGTPTPKIEPKHEPKPKLMPREPSFKSRGQRREITTPYVVTKRAATAPKPRVPFEGDRPDIIMAVEDSVTDELIYCLFDRVGRKMISRHILAKYNMTWEQYLDYCSLPPDYPRVAPKYSDQVSSKMAVVMTKKRPVATGAEARKRREKAIALKREHLLNKPDFGLSAALQTGEVPPAKNRSKVEDEQP